MIGLFLSRNGQSPYLRLNSFKVFIGSVANWRNNFGETLDAGPGGNSVFAFAILI
jgi:hypothetical protein